MGVDNIFSICKVFAKQCWNEGVGKRVDICCFGWCFRGRFRKSFKTTEKSQFKLTFQATIFASFSICYFLVTSLTTRFYSSSTIQLNSHPFTSSWGLINVSSFVTEINGKQWIKFQQNWWFWFIFEIFETLIPKPLFLNLACTQNNNFEKLNSITKSN